MLYTEGVTQRDAMLWHTNRELQVSTAVAPVVTVRPDLPQRFELLLPQLTR